MPSGSKQPASANSNTDAVLASNPVSGFLTEQLHFETVHALTRDNQRLRDESHYFQMHLHNAGRHQQQSNLYTNQVKQDLQLARTELAQCQAGQTQLLATFNHERTQNSRLAASMQTQLDDLLHEQEKAKRLTFFLTSLNFMGAEDLILMLDSQVDLGVLVEKYRAMDQGLSDEEGELRKTAFTLKCYQDLYAKNKDDTLQLYQVLAQKDSIIEELQADLYRSSTDEEAVEEVATIGAMVRASECQEGSSRGAFST
jgi:hypothetical protein